MVINLVEKRATKSKVWKYFGLFQYEKDQGTEEDRPVCKLCQLYIKTKRGNTSNLLSHLKNKHARVYKDLKTAMEEEEQRPTCISQVQPTLKEVVSRNQPYTRNSKRWTELTTSVICYPCKGCPSTSQLCWTCCKSLESSSQS